jgi:HEAT repeats
LRSANTDDIARIRARCWSTDGDWSSTGGVSESTCSSPASRAAPWVSRTSLGLKTADNVPTSPHNSIPHRTRVLGSRSPHGGWAEGPGAALSHAAVAAEVNQALISALTGQGAVLNARTADWLAAVSTVAPAIEAVMLRRGITLAQQSRVTQVVYRSGIAAELLDALQAPDDTTRAAAARLCGALRLADAVPWLSELLQDPEEPVREAAARALGRTGGLRAVDALMSVAESFPAHRLAVDIARAASDIDLDAWLRKAASVRATVVVALACGLRADALRFPRLMAMARDPHAAPDVRAAACRALGMIGDRAAAGVLRNLSTDPDQCVSGAASRALRRYHPGLPRH